MCGCDIFCCCPKEKAKPNQKDSICEITEEVVAWVSLGKVGTISGKVLAMPQRGGIRAGQVITVDCHKHIYEKPVKSPHKSSSPVFDTPHIGNPKLYSGFGGTPIFTTQEDTDYYAGTIHSFNFMSTVDLASKYLSSQAHVIGDADNTLATFMQNYCGNGLIEDQHRYSIDRINMQANLLNPSGHDFEFSGGELAGGLEYGINIRGPGSGAYAPWIVSGAGTPAPGIPWPDPGGRGILIPDGGAGTGTGTEYYVYPFFSRLDLNTGVNTDDTQVKVAVGSGSFGSVRATLYWETSAGTVASADTGRYWKNYDPFTLTPYIDLVVDDPVDVEKHFTFWSVFDNEMYPGRDYEQLLLPNWQYQPLGFLGDYGLLSSFSPYSSPPSPDPTDWENTENYYFRSKSYGANSFIIQPKYRDDNSVARIEDSIPVEAVINGIQIGDDQGNDYFKSWTFYEYGDKATLVLICLNDDILLYEGLTERLQVYVGFIPFIDLFGFVINPLGISAIGFNHIKAYSGFIVTTSGLARLGRYDPYQDSPATRWKEYGFKRPSSKAKYDAYINAAILAGKTIEDVTPPSYSGNPLVKTMIKDFFPNFLPAGYGSTQKQAILPSVVQRLEVSTGNWINDSTLLPKIAKQAFLPGATDWVDQSDDNTGLKGRYRVVFDNTERLISGRATLYSRFAGPISNLDIRYFYDPTDTLITIAHYESGIFDFAAQEMGSAAMEQKNNEFRTTVAAMDVEATDLVILDIEARTLLTQMYFWIG